MSEVTSNYIMIERIFAFLSVDPRDGYEGILSVPVKDGQMPLIGADMDRVESLKPIAMKVGRMAGVKVRLAVFSSKTILEEYEPGDS